MTVPNQVGSSPKQNKTVPNIASTFSSTLDIKFTTSVDNTSDNIAQMSDIHASTGYPTMYNSHPLPSSYSSIPVYAPLQSSSYPASYYHPHHYPVPQPGVPPPQYLGSNRPDGNNLYYAADELWRPEVEETFCNNFVCCGQYLSDLHALLQHYEEAHIQVVDNTLRKKRNRLEDVAADSLLEVGGAATISAPPSTMNSNYRMHSNSAPVFNDPYNNATYNNPPNNHTISSTNQHQMYQHNQLLQHNPQYSAFDTTLIRKTADSEYEYLPLINNIMSRPMSSPAHPHIDQHTVYNGQQINYGSKMQALTADKNNLQLLCSVLHNSLDPIPSIPPSPSNNDFPLGTNTPPSMEMSNNGKFYKPSSTRSFHSNNISYSSITVNNIPAIIDRSASRPYRCPIPSCARTYKNPNGLKYHAAHGHALGAVVVEKPFVCNVDGCTKGYKNPNGLKYHLSHAHRLGVDNGSKGKNGFNRTMDSDSDDSDSEHSNVSHGEFITEGLGCEEFL